MLVPLGLPLPLSSSPIFLLRLFVASGVTTIPSSKGNDDMDGLSIIDFLLVCLSFVSISYNAALNKREYRDRGSQTISGYRPNKTIASFHSPGFPMKPDALSFAG